MKITAAKLIICSPDRNFITLRIDTDEGIYGLGDATLNGRELAVASYLQDHILPCLIGRDPFQTEDIWQYLYRGAYWRRGPITMSAIAAVDVALWDIKGKALKHSRLQPARRPSPARAASFTPTPTAPTSPKLSTPSASTWTKATLPFALRPESPVSPAATEFQKPASPYEPAERGLPSESLWSSERYLNFAPTLFEKTSR